MYGKSGEYFYLAPVNDTNLTGYILAGWVEFDHDNKQMNEAAIAGLPDFQRDVVRFKNKVAVSNELNLTRMAFKAKHSDSLFFDDKHLLQDSYDLLKKPDSIPLYFEKQ